MSALFTLKSLFNRRRPCEAGLEDCHSAEPTSCKAKELSTEAEVNCIKDLLERKFNRKFQMRVNVEGFLGEKMNYHLVVDDHCANDDPKHGYHSIYGYGTSDILDVKREFLKSYWDRAQKVHDSIGKTLDKWDSDIIARYKDTMVASSREELLIQNSTQDRC